MKLRTLIVVLAFVGTHTLFGQIFGQIETVSVGMLPAVSSSTSLKSYEMNTSVSLYGFVWTQREKSFTTLAYNFTGNSLSVFHGWSLDEEKTQDLYLIVAKPLDTKGGYIGVGYEIYLDYALPFVELGSSWSSVRSEDLQVTVGVIFPLAKTIWKKEHLSH